MSLQRVEDFDGPEDEKAVFSAQIAALSTLIEHLQTEAEISANRDVLRKNHDVSPVDSNNQFLFPLCAPFP